MEDGASGMYNGEGWARWRGEGVRRGVSVSEGVAPLPSSHTPFPSTSEGKGSWEGGQGCHAASPVRMAHRACRCSVGVALKRICGENSRLNEGWRWVRYFY